jgi:hypothetical protein
VTSLARIVTRDPARWLVIPAAAWLFVAFFPRGMDVAHSARPAFASTWLDRSQIVSVIPMIAATMLPLVVNQLDHLSIRARRGGSYAALIFGLAYFWLWFVACGFLSAIAEWLGRAQVPHLAVGLGTIGVGLGWQQTPFKLAAMRRCHRLPAVRAEGAGLLADSCALGLSVGLWCVVSCWPWMLLCCLFAHNIPVMATLACALWFERFGIDRPFNLGEIAAHFPLSRRAFS